MQHKYHTKGVVLARYPLGEASGLLTLVTPTLGVVRARAQSVRKGGAKLAAALVTLAHAEIVLVRGREGWRLTGAVLEQNYAQHIATEARVRAGRVLALVQRLVPDETREGRLYELLTAFLNALATEPEARHEAAELLVVARLLGLLGLEAGDVPGVCDCFSAELLDEVSRERGHYIARINHGIAASGL